MNNYQILLLFVFASIAVECQMFTYSYGWTKGLWNLMNKNVTHRKKTFTRIVISVLFYSELAANC